MPWSSFLKAPWECLAAIDFFTVEVWGMRGLVTFYLLIVIELSTRRVHLAGITPSPKPAMSMPPRSPNLNAYCERFVRSIKSECLEKMIFFDERSLLRAATSFLDHYHEERNHQGLDNQLIDPTQDVGHANGKIQCRERLGGILRYYFRQAA